MHKLSSYAIMMINIRTQIWKFKDGRGLGLCTLVSTRLKYVLCIKRTPPYNVFLTTCAHLTDSGGE